VDLFRLLCCLLGDAADGQGRLCWLGLLLGGRGGCCCGRGGRGRGHCCREGVDGFGDYHWGFGLLTDGGLGEFIVVDLDVLLELAVFVPVFDFDEVLVGGVIGLVRRG